MLQTMYNTNQVAKLEKLARRNKWQTEIIIFLFVVTAAGVVPCGIPKKRPRTSSIVQFIFYFWSFEISRNIGLDLYRFRFIYS